MGEIKVELDEEDIQILIEEGALIIPLGEAIIDKEPAVHLDYEPIEEPTK